MKRWFDAHPHPNPPPRGEGTGSENDRWFVCFFGQSSRRSLDETANVSPSPGAEGRGEGVRHTISPPSFTSSLLHKA